MTTLTSTRIKFISEGRTPIKHGVRRINNSFDEQVYLVPPVGYDRRDIKRVYWKMNILVFVNKLGVERCALAYALTDDQSSQVENRIKVEKDK